VVDTLAVALVAGLLGGAAVAVIGGLITLVVQRRDHAARRAEVAGGQAHERVMAREQRLQDRRARAYERALMHAYRLDTWVERTEPIFGPVPDPPPPLPDDELWQLNALTAAHASPHVQALTLEMAGVARTFSVAAMMVADERAGHSAGQAVPPRVQLVEARTKFHAVVRAFADRIGAELRGDV
jgi:hypothetical protein